MKRLLICISFVSQLAQAEHVSILKTIPGVFPDAHLRAMSADAQFAAIHFSQLPNGELIRVVDLQRRVFTPLAVSGDKVTVAFSPDSERLFIGRTDGFLEVYDIPTNALVASGMPVGSAPIGAISFDNSSGSERLFISTTIGAYLVDFSSLTIIHRFIRDPLPPSQAKSDDPFAFMRFNSDVMPSGLLAAESDVSKGTVSLYDLQAGDVDVFLACPQTEGVLINKDGPSVNSPSTFLNVKFAPRDLSLYALQIDVKTKDVVLENFLSPKGGLSPIPVTTAANFHPSSFALSGDGGRTLVTPTEGWTCAMFVRAEFQTTIALSTAEYQDGVSVQITPDGRTGLTLSDDGILRLWSLP